MDAWTPTYGAGLLAAAVLLPFVAMLLGLALGGRWMQRVVFTLMPLQLAVSAAIAWLWLRGDTLVYLLGGWAPPLGIALRADGAAVAMLLAVAVVVCGIGLYARADFGTPPEARESRAAFGYWLLLLAVWGALNLVFVSGDLFTLYVALELLTFAGVPLVCLAGSGETLRAALRYLLFALCGSVLYLLGAVLLYGGYGTLDIPLLAQAVQPEPIAWAALALMTVGLLAKTALFPLHIWLPPAHGGAPAAASAVLSALVIKGSWFLVLRLWLDVMPGVATASAAQLLAALGAAAIVVGSVVALRQQRLKLLVAYSTVAQIGYLFLLFPMAFDADGVMAWGELAQSAGLLQAIAHATAKAGMFMAAGLIYAALGHDRIDDLAGAARALPLAVAAFFVGGLALMGVLPSGAYLAKKLLLASADESGQWWWTWVLTGGAAFTAGYVVLIAARVFRRPAAPLLDLKPVSLLSQWAALGLSLASLALALTAVLGPLPASLISNPLSPKDLGNTLAVLTVGTLLAWGLARRPLFTGTGGALRAATQVLARGFERGDHFVRRWPSAMVALLGIAAAFGWLLV
ncbi:MAG TPA: proton-conducting transporter membrane subunit, partial [Rubrivivax sp.]|nr:proton-conducting transporter membrane subunit [Rubrivivax sp.]